MNDIAAPFRLTSLAHGGGCGCKIAPGVLSDILQALPRGAATADTCPVTVFGDD